MIPGRLWRPAKSAVLSSLSAEVKGPCSCELAAVRMFSLSCLLRLCLFLFLSHCGATHYNTAIILENYPKKQNEPLFLSLDYQLLVPSSRGRIHLKDRQAVLTSCPGPRNALSGNGTELPNPTEARCFSSEDGCLLETGRGFFKLHQLRCKSPAWGWTLLKNKTCGPSENGIEVELAFQVRTHVITLITCCLDIRTSTTFFCKHTIRGEYIANKVATRKGNFVSGDGRLFDPSLLYKMTNQREILPSLVNDSIYLTKGHLAPPEDFLLRPHQMMAYTFANTAPRWKSVSRYWKLVERRVRRVASQQRADLEVVTGSSGVFKYNGRTVMLGEGRLPVPEVFWKVIKTKDGTCLGIICSNDPSLESKPVCEDNCAQFGWRMPQAVVTASRIYCCTYQAMRLAIPELPKMACS